ncbi:MAG: 4-hydroxy-tetrahydrodipicolinate synthase, partial [Acidimicrobiia bacterium]|nr:4-hydroxy-tetrahydrodipicolinate synthase [Acidimicrobiia bacterium]
MARFGSVVTAMITPFDKSEALDLAGVRTLARWLVDQGNQGLVIAGTTGESPTLTHEEQAELFSAVRDAVTVPIVAGVGSNSTRESLGLIDAAHAAGVDGLLVVTPYYNRPSQAGLDRHFRTLADATDLPIMLYDIPVRTGRKIDTGTLLALAHEVDNIVALKDAAGDPAETASFIAQAPDDFEVYSGDDSLTLPLLAVGAVGVVGVATHWCAPEMGEMIAAYEKGDVQRAREINALLIASYDFETGL